MIEQRRQCRNGTQFPQAEGIAKVSKEDGTIYLIRFRCTNCGKEHDVASGVDPDEEVELAGAWVQGRRWFGEGIAMPWRIDARRRPLFSHTDGRGTANLEQTCRECRRPYHITVESGSAAAWSR